MNRLIDVVEAAYSLEGTDENWLNGLAQASAPALDRGHGIVAYLGAAGTLQPRAFASHRVGDGVLKFIGALAQNTSPGARRHEGFLGQPMHFISVRETPFFGDALLNEHWEAAVRDAGIADGVAVYTHGAPGSSMYLFAASPVRETPSPRERRAWLRVAVHLSAGHRLRARWSGEGDAILDSDGRVHDARGKAVSRDARDSLRDAVRAMEKARGPLRNRDGEQALDLWQGLVAGRWSLVDRWDSDGKRYITAVENRPMNLDPRALRPREGAAAKLAADGASSKDIAWALGISPSNARALLASALTRLGLKSRAELYRWNPAKASVHVLPSDPKLHALVIPEQQPQTWSPEPGVLTDAETIVARLAAEGRSNEDIARERGTSVRTIANQMAKILKKLGVGSRADILRSGPHLRAS